MSENSVDFTDDEIQKLLEQFDSPEKIEQFYYILKLLIDDSIDDEEEVEFDVYIKKVKHSEEPKEDIIENLE